MQPVTIILGPPDASGMSEALADLLKPFIATGAVLAVVPTLGTEIYRDLLVEKTPPAVVVVENVTIPQLRRIKHFLTAPTLTIRPPYVREAETFIRPSLILTSVNFEEADIPKADHITIVNLTKNPAI